MVRTLPIHVRHGKTLNPDGLQPTASPAWISSIDNPYLHGLYAPTTQEVEASDLPVEGTLPRDLWGAYFRNGPNPVHAPKNRYHWFDGDGMVHGIWFENGKARYCNRWIRTPGFVAEQESGSSIWGGVLGPFDFTLPGGPLKDTANTDLIAARGRLWALWYESGQLVALDPHSLATLGPDTFEGKLRGRMSAHSKFCPHTGDLVFFSYGDRPPYMRYGVVSADGRVHRVDITLPGPRRPHDIGITPRFSVLHDFPVFFDPAVFQATGKRIPLFHREVPTRFGLIPRWGTDADVRWFSFEPCYMLHIVNCWEEGDNVVMIGCRTDDPTLRPDPADGPIAAMLSGIKLQARLYRWTMNWATGETSETALDDFNAEFPTIHPQRVGIRNQFAYLQHIPYEIPAAFHGLVKTNLDTLENIVVPYGDGIFGSEAPFAPRAGRPADAAEDDGYVVTFVTDRSDWSSWCWVYAAQDVAAGPLAKVKLPHRVPAGFHATWVPGEELP